MSTSLRLSEILGRGVVVEWFEAVALVREVADRVRDSVGGRSVPELDQIQLRYDGTVSIDGALTTDEPVRRLGQLLQACLTQTDPPVQLRLTLAQATAPEPGYGSMGEYSDALAYFERPDRSRVLQALFVKADSMPAAPVIAPATLDEIAPLQKPERKSRRAESADARPRPSRRAVFAIAAIAMFIVAATATYTQFGSAPVRPGISDLAVKASDTVGTTLVKGISAVSEKVGLGRLVSKEAAATAVAPAPAASTTPAARKPSRRTERPVAAAPTSSLRIFDLVDPPLQQTPPAVADAEELDPVPPLPIPLNTDKQVYSADDASVMPPVGVRPQLPRVLPANITSGQLSRIELLILPDGTVSSVRLVGGRGGVLDGMLLSAAKNWTFKPAERDGHPVMYRKIVWLVRD
jgi:hypothetical protein